ncbi:sulfatase-like hydrolase/transferase [Chitinophaga horti]|uniref:Sulfatase-like hydrolase/transferase n=1 Tax=Chitinophaga horti TaxID=2920382 RepID=A0ABY6J3T6_9BACT|nr:sulfatase-like hydrolase/transferase [Chitinophaga horti]UYQ94335.1 sulfatase-like hydrolase/transferase [Chitinophaga horti]
MKKMLLVTLLFAPMHYLQAQSPVKPNVVIILTDDMGVGDIACYGGQLVPTPNIDQMARNGLMCTQYYSAAPICSPSRAGLLTGQYPGRWNFATYLDNKKHNRDAEQADYLDPKAPSIARIFKNAGYATAHFGKWHLGGGRDVKDAPGFEQYGIDEHSSTYESPDPDPLLTATNWIWSDKDSIKRWDRSTYFVDKALDFLQRHRDQPCFINLWPDDVHTPWVPDAEQHPSNREEEAALVAVMKEYDMQIGRFLSELKRHGLDKNTIVIFTSDNGPLPSFRGKRAAGLRGTKLSLYEGGTRMPFIVNWTGHVKAGSVDHTSPIHATDLLPTLASMAGVSLPKNYKGDGIDRSRVLLGQPAARKQEMYWEYGRNTIAYRYPRAQDKSPQLAVRSGDWKLLMNHDGSGVELYNIVKDKTEAVNLADKEAKVVGALKEKLLKWWEALPKLKTS